MEHEGPVAQDALRRIQDGDAGALGVLYDLYGGIAYGLARRITGDESAAEDVVQEAFIAAWRNARRFDASRATVRTWLLSIVHHKAVDSVRRRAVRSERTLPEVAAEVLPAPERTDEAAERQVDAEAVRSALAEIPEDQRQVIELAYYSGLTYVEVAARMSIPVGTVKSRMRLGLEKLRAALAPRVTQ